MQEYVCPLINCLLSCMKRYSWGVIRSSDRIRARSHRIGTVVNFTTIRCSYDTDPFRCGIRERSLIIPGRGRKGNSWATKPKPENLMGHKTNFEITDRSRNKFLYYPKKIKEIKEINEFLNPLCILRSQLKD